MELSFPSDFRWGVSTAAYQIEGAVAEDGRTPSIWDTFAHTPGRVLNSDTGDVAVDHYHRFRDDVALMSSLGLPNYRFSIAWSRVQPDGTGPANQRGLDFYRSLVDELLGAGIEPWVTLYHWDLPESLETKGGWPVRETAFRFAEYAGLVRDALGDRVRHWSTVNEPWCAAYLGYASGVHAPGRQESQAAPRAAHHLLLAHGLVAHEMDAGIVLNLYPVTAATDDERDVDAARRIDGLQNRFFLDAVLRGEYPADVLADLDQYDLGIRDGDLETISAPIDALGINYYNRYFVTGRPGSAQAATSPFEAASPWPGSEHVGFEQVGRPVTAMGWEIDGTGLADVLRRVANDYRPVPLYVAENGAAFDDRPVDGGVDDQDRIGFFDEHLRGCHEVIEEGVPLQGYFAWSLLDNFEWSWGFGKRFGLVRVDYATQVRLPKASALWYAAVVARGGLATATSAVRAE
jgi:beta-glucosidase